MINLSVSDPIDGFDKIGELRNAIGKTFDGDVNRLIWVSADGNTCHVEKDGRVVSEPSWLTWNRLFF